jgi:CDP-glucose 4,6-dehydratase
MSFWSQKKVFLTGHTGFKGSWLTLWLQRLGADVTGYSLAPDHSPSMFNSIGQEQHLTSQIANILDLEKLQNAVHASNPDVVFHFAAQPIVADGYEHPHKTFATNIMGTVNVLESIRGLQKKVAVVIVTTDKCYEIRDHWDPPFIETDRLGGADPYSSSKSCAELVTHAYYQTYFSNLSNQPALVTVATARGGNAIGGGDYGKDRLIPDAIRAWSQKIPLVVRNLDNVRPWQHVLDLLNGYMLLAESLYHNGDDYSGGWNFGPDTADEVSVSEILKKAQKSWGPDAAWTINDQSHYKESHILSINSDKAKSLLDWRRIWSLDDTIHATITWYKKQISGADMRQFSIQQIESFINHR